MARWGRVTTVHRPSAAALLGILALFVGFVTAPSSAQEGNQGPAILLILDASGSMNRVDDNGVKLIDGAQEALVRLVESMPEGLTVGLRVYGHRVPNTDKRNGCKDTDLIVPPGPLDREAMTEAIRSFSAKGFTPIGLSLREAAADLEPVGGGTIVLVSDGEDTCAPPPPCEVAEDLIAQGYRIQVHSVGFLLEEGSPARDELQCIADATGGSYGEVYEIDFLTSAVGRIVSEAVPEGNYHIPFDGATVRAEAPLLEVTQPLEDDWHVASGGFYSTRIRPGETRWYRLELEEGKDIEVGSGIWLDFFTDVPDGEAFEILIVDADGNDVRELSPARQPSRVDVASVVDSETAGMAAQTRSEIFRWEHLDEEALRNAQRQGFTQESYEQWINQTYRGVVPGPLDPGTYYIGLLWDSTRSPDVQIGLDFWVTVEQVDYSEFNLHPERVLLQGATTLEDAAILEFEQFDPWPFPPLENDPFAEGSFSATITAGETLWYVTHLEWDSDLHIGAFLHRPLDTPTAPGETFGVRIFGPIAQVEGPEAPGAEINPGQPGALIPLDDDSVLRHDEPQWLPRPDARATSAYLGDSSPPPQGWEGNHYVAITWDSSIGNYEAEVEFVVDLVNRCRNGVCGPREEVPVEPEMVEPPSEASSEVPATPPTTPGPEQPPGMAAPLPSTGEGGGVSPLLWVGAGVAIVILAGGALVLRRNRI